MLSSILIAAAEHAEHAEPSKTPFYIAGAVLVIWACFVSFAGIRSDSFAASKASGTLVAVVSAVLVVATMFTSVITG